MDGRAVRAGVVARYPRAGQSQGPQDPGGDHLAVGAPRQLLDQEGEEHVGDAPVLLRAAGGELEAVPRHRGDQGPRCPVVEAVPQDRLRCAEVRQAQVVGQPAGVLEQMRHRDAVEAGGQGEAGEAVRDRGVEIHPAFRPESQHGRGHEDLRHAARAEAVVRPDGPAGRRVGRARRAVPTAAPPLHQQLGGGRLRMREIADRGA
ncbi:hypothetical protein GCM10010300_17990 [Streptomyces olivaceoviridis]|nr:hypothetical protein GCM10010300_17990 [Streptomyces olivaceoviridis]